MIDTFTKIKLTNVNQQRFRMLPISAEFSIAFWIAKCFIHLTGCAHGLLYFSTSWSPSDEHPWTSNNTQATTKTAKKPRTLITFLSSSQAVKRFLQFWRYGGRLNIKAHCRVYQQKYSVSLKITFLHERSVSGSKLWPGIRVRSAHNQHARYC